MDTEKLNALKEQAHKTAVEHGFHEDVKSDAFYLGLVMSEAGEAINADRKGLHADAKGFEEDEANGLPFAESFKKNVKDSVEDEIADIVIRLLDFAGLKEYELSISPCRLQINFVFLWVLKKAGCLVFFFSLCGLLVMLLVKKLLVHVSVASSVSFQITSRQRQVATGICGGSWRRRCDSTSKDRC